MGSKEAYNGRVYRAAIYVRLSKEDGDKAESDSIVNQKDLIKNYVSERRDIVVCMECVDDGYSGVDFERPNFRRMICEIEAGTINCVIVKDLSRFGRNFVETGRYLDQIFPALGIRFIAVNDGIDSINGRTTSDRILIPFKNLINDAYCRDISIKIRSQLAVKRKKGDFIGSFAVYGYRRDPDDRHKLVVDDYAAAVVQDIFKWKLKGASQQKIADWLNERGELSPMEYKRFCGLKYQSGFQVNSKTRWTAVAVGRILQNECYIGTLVQGKCTTPNHKVKKVIYKSPKEWVRVENSHAPIVDREVFDAVRRLLLQDMRVAPNEKRVYPLSGLLFCADCCSNMVRNSVYRNGTNYIYYMCGRNRTSKECSSHRVSNAALEQVVCLVLRWQIALSDILAKEEFWQTELYLCKKKEKEKIKVQMAKKQEEVERYNRLKESLDKSMLDGLLDKEEYLQLKESYEEKIQEAYKEKRKGEERKKELENNFVEQEKAGNFTQRSFAEINRHLIILLVERMEVYKEGRLGIYFCYHDRNGDGYGKDQQERACE